MEQNKKIKKINFQEWNMYMFFLSLLLFFLLSIKIHFWVQTKT